MFFFFLGGVGKGGRVWGVKRIFDFCCYWSLFDIFQGPPGTGKTTSILALAHELLGPNYREAVLELNASDDRWVHNAFQVFLVVQLI